MGKLISLLMTMALLVNTAFAGDFDDVDSAIQRKNFGVAVKLLQPTAEQGDPRAQAYLAFVILGRNDVPTDYPAAVFWARKAADQGEATGKVILGRLYLTGQGVQQDEEQGVTLIRQSAALNNPLGHYELGKLMLLGRGTARDVTEGEKLLEMAAGSHPVLKAKTELIIRKADELDQWRSGISRLSCDGFLCAGRLGLSRQSLKKDYENMEWVELAATALDVGYRSDLLYFYLGRASEGLGDLREALIYYNLAMNPREFGNRCDSPFNNCDGIVLPADALRRRNLVTIAIQEKSNRDAERQTLAEKTRKAIEATESARLASEKEALRLKELAESFAESGKKAEVGSSEAQYHLAQMYFAGTGTSPDERAGLIWLTKSALQGNSDAQYDLGERYQKGLTVEQDNLKAEMWFRKAIQQGRPDTNGSFSALLAEKQERLNAASEMAKKRAATAADITIKRAAEAAAIEKKQDDEKAELARKTKLKNAEKLKSL